MHLDTQHAVLTNPPKKLEEWPKKLTQESKMIEKILLFPEKQIVPQNVPVDT